MLNKLSSMGKKLSVEQRKIISNIGWLFGDRILRMGVGLVVGAWVARYLQPEQFGLLNYAIAFVFLFTAFATLGLDQIVVRNLVRNPDCKDETLGTTFALKLIGGIVTLLLASLTIFLLRPDDYLTRALVAITASATIFQAFDTIDFCFQFQVSSKYTVVAKNSAFIIVTLVRITLIQLQAPLIAFAWAAFAETALGGIALMIAYKVSGQNFRRWRVSWQEGKNLLKESWPLIIAGVSIMLYIRIDTVMLGEISGSEAVGIYAVATRLSELWGFIPIAIISSVTPSIIEAKKVSETLYYQKLQKIFTLVTVLAYSIAIPLTLLSTPIIVLMFGQNYAPAGSVLAIHIWGQIFSFLGIARSIWIVTEGLTKYALIFTTGGAVINILLNLWLIPMYQETGAAIATVVSYALVDYVIFILYPPFRHIGKLMTNALILRYLLTSLPNFRGRG
jgi:PST family polysaccharide transporter